VHPLRSHKKEAVLTASFYVFRISVPGFKKVFFLQNLKEKNFFILKASFKQTHQNRRETKC
jgi:hypothetical protein